MRIAISFQRCLLLAPLVILFASSSTWAGAWAQPKGHMYAKVSGIFYAAEDIYNDMGQRQQMGLNDDKFSSQQMFVYLEYGLLEALSRS